MCDMSQSGRQGSSMAIADEDNQMAPAVIITSLSDNRLFQLEPSFILCVYGIQKNSYTKLINNSSYVIKKYILDLSNHKNCYQCISYIQQTFHADGSIYLIKVRWKSNSRIDILIN